MLLKARCKEVLDFLLPHLIKYKTFLYKSFRFVLENYVLTKDKRKLSITILSTILIFSYGYKILFKQATHHSKNLSRLSVSVIKPILGNIAKTVTVTGEIIPKEEVLVTSELGEARIKNIFARQGDHVVKGQKLLELDSERLENIQKELESEYEIEADSYARAEQLRNTGGVSEESLIQKFKKMESAKAKLANAKLKFTGSIIYSPETGVIFEKNATIGAFIDQSKPLYRIILDNKLEMEAEISETLLPMLKIGQDATIDITSNEKPILGKICLINLKIEEVNRTGKIRICFENDKTLPIGLFASANIVTGQASGMLLPISALQEGGNGSYVWNISKDNAASILPVKLKIKNYSSFIIEDIDKDSRIIAKAGAFLREGDVVNVIEGN